MPHSTDVHVGQRIKLKRKLVHLTQTDLARALKLTFQQIQKYESGANRVSASKLWDISKVLKCDVGFFFHGVDDKITEEEQEDIADNDKISQDMINLNDRINNIKDKKIQKDALKSMRATCAICGV